MIKMNQVACSAFIDMLSDNGDELLIDALKQLEEKCVTQATAIIAGDTLLEDGIVTKIISIGKTHLPADNVQIVLGVELPTEVREFTITLPTADWKAAIKRAWL